MDVWTASLIRHHDLENYLTPLVRRLGAEHFNLVEAAKRVGGGSRLTIGSTVVDHGVLTDDWRSFECRTGSGPDRRGWKERLRETLMNDGVVELPAGPVAMEVEWSVSRGRNWLNLWKPTFDAMGPVLGEPDNRNPFNPADDHVMSLRLHRTLDDSPGWEH